jgi:hypothetical protein
MDCIYAGTVVSSVCSGSVLLAGLDSNEFNSSFNGKTSLPLKTCLVSWSIIE